MSINKRLDNFTEDSPLLGVLQASGSAINNFPVQEALAKLQLEELQRLQGIRQSGERDKRVARDSNVVDIKKKLEEKEFSQSSCAHRKPAPSHESAIAGQRDHRGKTHFICQYCQKEWLGLDLPPEYRISGDRIGGPTL